MGSTDCKRRLDLRCREVVVLVLLLPDPLAE